MRWSTSAFVMVAYSACAAAGAVPNPTAAAPCSATILGEAAHRVDTRTGELSMCLPDSWEPGQDDIAWIGFWVSTKEVPGELHASAEVRVVHAGKVGPLDSVEATHNGEVTIACNDCLVERRVNRRSRRVGGRDAQVTLALVSGGMAHRKDVPTVNVRWKLAQDVWLLATVEAPDARRPEALMPIVESMVLKR